MKTGKSTMLVLYGPTATGKTDLGIKLAKCANGELISADSRQVYKGLDIGTGKVSFKSKVEKHNGYWIVDGVKIRGFDLIEPGKQFTVADFLKFANSSVIQITELKKMPIVVGGTGFYIKALVDGMDTLGIKADQKLRAKLEKLSRQELYLKLGKLNPQKAKSMNESDRKNPRRLIRAIEVSIETPSKSRHSGVASTTIESRSHRSVPLRSRMTEKVLIIGLTAPNNFLFKRADASFKARLEHGMIEEIQSLIKGGISPEWINSLGLEYRRLADYILGKTSKEESVDLAKGDLHRLIRRQKTWFNKFKSIELFDISQKGWENKLDEKIAITHKADIYFK
ncbi:MAG: tRNA (adenosine(37)-N6)-dimethylallyltransferase MiaA [Candidatus Curtissbacteria bacterium]|nr:tRNA (adenosine(37)-N6)-dimethylallyltransferase MiaA [Candidatus Curtissbacteria bacterium]